MEKLSRPKVLRELPARRNKKGSINFRMRILMAISFLLCISLIVKLGQIQIAMGTTYAQEAEKSGRQQISHSTPRGMMYDRYGRSVVTNRSERAITYTRYRGVSRERMLETARVLSSLLTVPTDKLTERDKKDFWILLNEKEAAAKIKASEKKALEDHKITDQELYQRQLSRITEADLAQFTDSDLEVLAIYRSMSQGYASVPQFIKNKDVTPTEYTMVSEQLSSLPGVDVTNDWERNYPHGELLRSVIGKVSTSDSGLPSEKADYYLARDYARNDRVGTSYLEEAFESVLQGVKEKERVKTTTSGEALESEVVQKGMRGKDLLLTIDLDLQLAVERIIEEELQNGKASIGPYADRAFMIISDPQTGEILAMAGKQLVKKDNGYEIKDFALGNVSTSYAMGSVVKGATVMTGLQTGAIQPGTRYDDAPVKLKSTPQKSSWRRYGVMDETTALAVSSNIYMFRTAMEVAKFPYVYDAGMPSQPEAFQTFRKYFNQFGLGISTGIKLPNETTGMVGTDTQGGLLLDFSIGQYDTYTPLQLVQYMSTIANNGYRIRPQLVQEAGRWNVDKQELDDVAFTMKPDVLNAIDIDPSYVAIVKEGFRRVMQDPIGTAYSQFGNVPYHPAGKTGTAQSFYSYKDEQGKWVHQPTYNLTLGGYAPHDNPEIAFSVVVPWVTNDKYPITKIIARRSLDAYFALQAGTQPRIKEREEESLSASNTSVLAEGTEQINAQQELPTQQSTNATNQTPSE